MSAPLTMINDSVWNHYTDLGRLGGGNFASVHLVEEKATGLKFAAKVCPTNDRRRVVPLEKEFKCLSIADHPGIVRLHAGYQDAKDCCLILEYAEHGDLMSFLQNRDHRLTENRVRKVMSQLLQAIEYIHANGFAHRDTKPQNFLIVATNPLTVKLADFGLVKQLNLNSLMWARQCSAGDDMFMAPEVQNAMEQGMPLRCEEYCKNDVFAMGCVLYYLLAGVPPDNKNVGSAFVDVANKFPNVSDLAIDLCQRMMDLNVNDRLSAREALAHDWFHSEINVRYPSNDTEFATPQSSQQSGWSSEASPVPSTTEVRSATPLLPAAISVPEESFAWFANEASPTGHNIGDDQRDFSNSDTE